MKQRNATIDYLRGLAAIMVCICHFRHTLPDFLSGLAKQGELGVQIFFVISGYIIPYSMERGGYKITGFGRFWLKRLLRLQPTFLVALILTFLLSQISARIKGSVSDFSVSDLAAAAVYLRVPGENPVIWTLIVELKYYLFISVLFPLLFSRDHTVRRLSYLSCLLLTVLLMPYVETLKHMPFFLFGFAACYFKIGRANLQEAGLLSVLVTLCAFSQSSSIQVATGVLTALAILFLPAANWRLGLFMGSISYSLYLIHFPLGVKIVNLTLPRVPGAVHWMVLPATTVLCSSVAYLLFRLVEEPSSKWSQRIEISK
jgi:peptidoglycan/LPS O-acetylase OafA/YrhL